MTPSPMARLGPVRQLGYLVENLDQAIAAWERQLAVGPWLIMRNISLDCTFRGAASQPCIDIAMAWRGEQQIELIQQRDESASPYLAHRQRGQFGLHHIAFLSADIAADTTMLQAAGLKLACDIRMPGAGRYVYFDSPVAGETSYIELLEATTMMRAMFADGINEAARWQGEPANLNFNLGPMLRLMRLGRRLWPRGGRA